jgi:hypothetical protein
MPISGVLCVSKVGWTAVYYLHGLVSIVLFTMFLLYHRNTPTVHPMVSRPELVKVSLISNTQASRKAFNIN